MISKFKTYFFVLLCVTLAEAFLFDPNKHCTGILGGVKLVLNACDIGPWLSWDPCNRRCGGGIQQRLKIVCCPNTGRYDSQECTNLCNLTRSDYSITRACNQICYNGGLYFGNKCQCRQGFTGTCCERATSMTTESLLISPSTIESTTSTVAKVSADLTSTQLLETHTTENLTTERERTSTTIPTTTTTTTIPTTATKTTTTTTATTTRAMTTATTGTTVSTTPHFCLPMFCVLNCGNPPRYKLDSYGCPECKCAGLG